MTVNKNDDVTVSGIVIGVEGNNVLLELNKGSRIWVEKEEIKTIRHTDNSYQDPEDTLLCKGNETAQKSYPFQAKITVEENGAKYWELRDSEGTLLKKRFPVLVCNITKNEE